MCMLIPPWRGLADRRRAGLGLGFLPKTLDVALPGRDGHFGRWRMSAALPHLPERDRAV
jgi:hypothetical protein